MNRSILATCVVIMLAVPAVAQTKDQCLTLASALPQVGLPMIELEKNLGAINWDSLLPRAIAACALGRTYGTCGVSQDMEDAMSDRKLVSARAEMRLAHLEQIEALTAPGLSEDERIDRFAAATGNDTTLRSMQIREVRALTRRLRQL